MLRYKSAEAKNVRPMIYWLAACYAIFVLSARPPLDVFVEGSFVMGSWFALLFAVPLLSYSEIDDRGKLIIVTGYFARKSIPIKNIVRIYKQRAFRFGNSWVLAVDYEDERGRMTKIGVGGIFASQNTMKALAQELYRRNSDINVDYHLK